MQLVINNTITLEEPQLIKGLKSGMEASFKQLVEHYQDKVMNTCLGFVPNIQDAEDICQEVFVQVYRSISKYREDASLSTWIYRISITKCLEHLRHKKRKKRMTFFQSLIGLDEVSDRYASLTFDHPGVSLERQEESRILFAHINRLPKNQRIVFVLHKIEHLSHKEIGEIMDLSKSAVESLVFRAKRQLRKQLITYYNEKKG